MSDKQIWAEVTDDGEGVPDGEFYPVKYSAGDIITGELAERAIKQKWAKKGKGSAPVKTTESAPLPDNLEERLSVIETQLADLQEEHAKALKTAEVMRLVAEGRGADPQVLDQLVADPDNEELFDQATSPAKNLAPNPPQDKK